MSNAPGNATIRLALTPRTLETIESRRDRADNLRAALSRGLERGLVAIEVDLQRNYVRGGHPRERRGGKTPLAVRSGALLGSIGHAMDNDLSGRVGSIRGAATAYARTILGDQTTTIRPRTAKHLWIPVADNLTRSGQARISPREAMERKGPRGGRLLKIFRSRAGNLVAVLHDKVPGVRRKGGKLLFVLKDQITIEGTDALGKAVEAGRPRLLDIIAREAKGAL